jgi:RIO kinase 1
MKKRDYDKILKKIDARIDFQKHKDRDKTRRRRTDTEVFDYYTLDGIYKLMSAGLIDTVEFPVKTGKEGNIYMARSPEGKMFALKIYRTTTATFKKKAKYIDGDPRFKTFKKESRKIVEIWASKEFKNMTRLHDNGIRVPKPVDFNRNILVMEFIGDENGPAPLIREYPDLDTEAAWEKLLDYAKLIYRKAGMVHCDYNEFNILMWEDEPVIIDVGQAVVVEHPMAYEFLEHDIKTIVKFFVTRGLELEWHEVLKEIVGNKVYEYKYSHH